MPTNSEVFISYSHDSLEHESRVLALSDRLRAEGIDVMIDQYQSAPPEGWQLWTEKQIRDAKFVLLVCTETYLRRVMKEETPGNGLGVMWEASIVYAYLYDAGVVNTKFIPVVFETSDATFIPMPLKPTTNYSLATDHGYGLLCRRLTDQPSTPAGPLGKRRELPPLPRPTARLSPPSNRLISNLVHPYPLEANFTGRVAERKELSEWLADKEHPIYELVAIGGMGKSALTWYWMTNDVLRSSEIELDGVMWWSFYESESGFARFVDDALRYFTDQPIDAQLLPTTYDRAQELRKQLQDRRVLIVLDGFERQLRVYATLGAVYQGDDKVEHTRDARACVDPTASRFLRELLAGATLPKVLFTTRLAVSDLEDRAGGSLARMSKRDLKELPQDDAVAFMRAQGVTKGASTEIANACAAYGYHPLSLRLLSGLIARDRRAPGDISAAPRHDVHDDLIQRQHHVLEQSYNALPEHECSLLSRIAAFRSPVTYDGVAIFNDFGNAAEFDIALDDLEQRGLVQRDLTRNRYDLHPIVRHYAYDRLRDRTGIHSRLRDYFAKIPIPDEAITVEELSPVIELFHHCVQAGRYTEARSIFRDRLNRPLYAISGQYDLCIELVNSLLAVCGPNILTSSPWDYSWLMNKLGLCYNRTGRSHEAETAFREQIAIREKMDGAPGIAVGLGNLSEVLIRMGRLKEASDVLKRKIDISRKFFDEPRETAGRQDYGLLLAYQGEFQESDNQLTATINLLSPRREFRHEGVSWAFSTVSKLLQGHFKEAVESAEHTLRLGATEGRKRDVVRADWLVGLAKILAGSALMEGAAHLEKALTDCRRINLVELEPDILLAMARWHRAKSNAKEAKALAVEALTIADRCEYRLKQAEIQNFLSLLALDAGDNQAAREHAEIAKERAWCDGPPHCYKPALDEAEAMLEHFV